MGPQVVAFCCDNSGYQAADMCGYLRTDIPPELEVVWVPCIGRVEPMQIMGEFEEGTSGVLLFGCYDDACRHIHGNCRVRARLKEIGDILNECGIDRGLVEFHAITAHEGTKFCRIVRQFCDRIKSGMAAKV